MERMKLNIQMFSDGKVVIDTELNTKNFEQGLERMENSSRKGGSTIKSIVGGLGITKMISMAMGQITSSVDSAISRVDTLNNFPKVMSNLGIGAEDAQKSIEKMSEKLSGLPTTLDQGASAVQRFTSKNNDVGKSTDLFLALNNAILAGGAGSEIQASALEQLSQAYAKGKPDMLEWRSAMTAMPAQLKQVATAMGYVNADELGQALRDGSVSMDEFMDTIVKLNENGVGEFKSFEEQARNSTGGINTAITVAKTQVVKGVADLIEGLNKGLEEADLPSITEIIAMVGKKAKEVIDVIAKNLPTIIKTLKTLAPILAPILASIVAFKTVTTIVSIVKSLTTAIGLLNAVLLANPIALIVAAIVGLVVAFVMLWKKSEDFRNFWIGLWEGIKNLFTTIWDGIGKFFTETIPNWIQGIIDWFKNLPYNIGYALGQFLAHIVNLGVSLWQWVTTELPEIIKGIVDWFASLPGKVWNFLTQIPGKIREMAVNLTNTAKTEIPKVINNIINFFKKLPGQIKSIGKNVISGLWNGIVGMKNWLANKISSFAKGIVDGFKKSLKIKSPSRVFRDEIGKYMAMGIGVGFEDEIGSVYNDMQHAINLEQAKLQANVETGRVFNTLQSSTPVVINLNADVEMDSTKVGRLVTPAVTKTIKNGGGV